MRLTVGELKKELEKYSDDIIVVVQRVEDKYYEGVDISGMSGRLPDGTFGILPPGSKSNGWDTIKKMQDNFETEYTIASCVCHYPEKDYFYIDLHY